ncbi:MAG TPA: mevalonate kinase [Thermoplasmata archaeon]|nr:mevalonate kinase [Thermoplasmata archaeon]
MAGCSAPGKLILFGEHAVVFGEPALALAVDLRAEVYARRHKEWLADGRSLGDPRYAYVRAALERAGARDPLWIEVRSAVPEGSGLGSSAAVTVATLGAVHGIQGSFDPAQIAREGFEVERAVQGRASPIDTSTATAGGALLVLPGKDEGLLWAIEKDGTRWYLHHRALPPLKLVVGFTGVSAPTGPLVAAVRERVEAHADARGWIAEIGEIAVNGLRALQVRDWVAAGEMMDRNHALLNALGVGHPSLDRLVAAARPTSYGAKLTGAGGGGSMVALTEDPERTARAITNAGGRAFVVHGESKGATMLP